MAAFKIRQTVDLNSAGPQTIAQAFGHTGDAYAHQWEVAVVRGGAAFDLTGYTAMALVNNGVGTVEIEGTISGNVATAIFPPACYTEGMGHECFMRISNASDSSEVITCKMHLNVKGSETDNPVDGGTSIGATLSGLLASEASRVAAESSRAAAETARQARMNAVETVAELADFRRQHLIYDSAVGGKYYDRLSTNQVNSASAALYPAVRVRAGVTYYYQKLYVYFCTVVYDDAAKVALSDNADATQASGSFYAEKDGTAYLTIAAASSVPITGAMFCDDVVPGAYTEGLYNVVWPIRTHTVTVKPSGGDFSNLRTCFDTIKPNYYNRYIVEIYEGDYDIRGYYTSGEWAVESTAFVGLVIPDYVTLRGVGRRDYIKLFAWDTVDRQYISTLNFCNTAAIENIRVEGTHLRYTIHDDGAWETGVERRVTNCRIVGEYLALNIVYGSGCKNGADWKFKDTIFQHLNNSTAFSNHNNTGWDREAFIDFDNCRFVTTDATNAIRFGTLNTGANGMITNVTMRGCKCAGRLHLIEENAALYGAGILFKVSGYGNSLGSTHITNTDAVDYSGNIDLI